MKKKIALLAFALGITLAAVWTPRANALPRYCSASTCASPTLPSYPCTCPGTSLVTTCGQWTSVCGF
ncbi:MAG TPA: hypothetical protein VFC23_11810 [Thermoanaerobaculia bacterium]|nr:hypothetical protein [Thermoanaerobaculia bacterium]